MTQSIRSTLRGRWRTTSRRWRSTPALQLAWAQLSRALLGSYSNLTPTAELATQAAAAAERARRLGPFRPESYLAQGTYERFVLKDNVRGRPPSGRA